MGICSWSVFPCGLASIQKLSVAHAAQLDGDSRSAVTDLQLCFKNVLFYFVLFLFIFIFSIGEHLDLIWTSQANNFLLSPSK